MFGPSKADLRQEIEAARQLADVAIAGFRGLSDNVLRLQKINEGRFDTVDKLLKSIMRELRPSTYGSLRMHKIHPSQGGGWEVCGYDDHENPEKYDVIEHATFWPEAALREAVDKEREEIWQWIIASRTPPTPENVHPIAAGLAKLRDGS